MNDWNYCQKNSHSILAAGLIKLKKTKPILFNDIVKIENGNYLISDTKNLWNYTGESKNLAKRLKQHSKENTSTFYKNYLKEHINSQKLLAISDFNLKIINTEIGRKELEEFCIVNIPTNLNKFQLNKRKFYSKIEQEKLWIDIQINKHQIIEQGEKELKKVKK